MTIKKYLADVADAMESLVKRLPNMTMAERVDVCARMRAIAKHVDAIDQYVKDEIKDLRPNSGEILGELFKAKIALVKSERLNQLKLKHAQPIMFENYVEITEQTRITFEVR